MKEREKIELSSLEVTSYWWINVIKAKVRELVIQGPYDKNEEKFLNIFYNFTEKDWRNLYLELINYIMEDINNFVPRGDVIGIDTFEQDTDVNGHDRINEELSKILNGKVPDIRLASNSSKDSVIYTNMFGASVWYKSCGVINLPTIYDANYILTGDEKELHFYNSLLATISVLKELDRSFNSVSILRNQFCKEYKKVNKLKNYIKELKDLFDYSFNKASDNDIIYGRFWDETYSAYFKEIDYNGLDEFRTIAEYYANSILEKNNELLESINVKKLKLTNKEK